MKNFKQLLSFMLVFAFILSFMIPAFAQTNKTNSLYEDSAKFLVDKGIMKGYPNGDLGLNRILTRAEVITLVERLIGKEEEAKNYKGTQQYFKDVPANHWAYGYVQLAKEQGIVNGYPDGTFKPDQKINFEELCKLLVVALNEKPNIGKWPLNYVTKAIQMGLIEGMEDELGLGDYVTRGQTAVAFAKAYKKAYPEPKPVEFQVSKVQPLNYKEIQIEFNQAITDKTYVMQPDNYEVKVNNSNVNISNVFALDNKSVVLHLENSFTNNDNVVVKVKNPEYTASGNYFVDIVPPSIEDVKGIGLMKVVVKFSEPVTGADKTSNYTIDDQYIVANVVADKTQREYTLTFIAPLTAGSHTLKVNNIKDFAGYNVVTPAKTFTLTADTTPITNPEVVSATQTEVKLKFNKDIYALQNVTVYPMGKLVNIVYNNNEVVLQFDVDNALPLGEVTVKFDAVDYSGNILKDASVKFVPTIDTTKPSFVNYSIESNNQIVVEFSENVRINAGEVYKLRATDGTVYTPVKVEYATADAKNKVRLTFDGLKENATYVFEISGVKDYTPIKNEMLPVTVNITIPDKTAPMPVVVYKAFDTNNKVVKLFVMYNEAVTNSAENKANYTLVYADNTVKSLAGVSNVSIKLMNDNKTVVIDFSAEPQTNIVSMAISNISDLANNVLIGVIKNVDAVPSTMSKVTAVNLISKTTLELTVEGNKLANVSPVDFWVYYKDMNNNDVVWTYPIRADYDAEANKIVLTLGKEINTDATVNVVENGQTVAKHVYVKPNPNGTVSTDILGNKLQILSMEVKDVCKPVIVNVTTGTRKGTIQVVFSEAIDTSKLPADLNNAVMLYKDNNRVTFTKFVWTNNNTTLVIGTDKIENDGELSAGIYKVIVDAGQFKDMNNNAMIYVAPYENVNVQ